MEEKRYSVTVMEKNIQLIMYEMKIVEADTTIGKGL